MQKLSQNTRKISSLLSEAEENSSVLTVEKTIGDTTYIVDYEISANARESAYDKIKKMILNDTRSLERCPTS